MKQLTVDEVKKIEFDVLANFADFCDENNLKYYLAYGTLLGAVRHKGFIPWDDDIDVYMPREDYNKLIEIFNNTNQNNRYELIAPKDRLSYCSFVKIIDNKTIKKEVGMGKRQLGVDIDIFPLDGQPEIDKAYVKWYKKLRTLYKRYWWHSLHFAKGYWKINLRVLLCKPFGISKAKCLDKAEKLHKMYPYNESKYIGSIECLYDLADYRYEKKWFDDYVLLEFEGKKFKAPVGYDEVLTKTYGDYMKLPPIEEQVTHHKNNVFILED